MCLRVSPAAAGPQQLVLFRLPGILNHVPALLLIARSLPRILWIVVANDAPLQIVYGRLSGNVPSIGSTRAGAAYFEMKINAHSVPPLAPLSSCNVLACSSKTFSNAGR